MLSFSNQTVGTKSAAQTVTLTNTGNAALTIAITITSTNSGDFSQTNTCGSSVAAGTNCMVSVTFAPAATGTRTAALTFTDNASNSPQSISLTGTGVSTSSGPVVSLSPTSLTFGNQTVGTTSAAQTVTLTNTGNAALTIAITITGTNSGDFSQTNTCGSSVAAGTNCTVSVTFTPAATGTRTAALTFTDNASNSPQTVSLTGTGTSSSSHDPLGTVTSSVIVGCPSGGLVGGTCYDVTISCPNVADSTPTIKVNSPSGTPLGTVIFTTGGGGNQFYDQAYTFGSTAINSVVQAGYIAAQTSFASAATGWLTGPGGPRKLACRYATAAQWVFDTANIHKGGTPLCATGNSGGSGAIAYSLAHYGLDSIFSMVEPTGGPPMGRVDIGCLCTQPDVQSFCMTGTNPQCYGNDAVLFIDPAYGNSDCSNHVAADATLWLNDSVASPDATLAYPTTFVHVVFGGQDRTPAVPLGMYWVNLITTSKKVECVLDAPHSVADVLDGATKIANDLIAGCHL